MKSTTRRLRLIGLSLAVLFGTSLAHAANVTLEQVLAAPFSSHLTGAAKGDRLAWLVEHQGRRNVWAADGPAYQARALTRYQHDDGQELSDLTLSADGAIVAYVRGGRPNKEGVSPNPGSDAKKPKQEVWVLQRGEREPRLIGEGSSPVIAPDGRSLAFVRSGQIFLTSLDRGAQPAQLFHVRGTVGSARFSPDGARIAFVSGRSAHSLIGVYDRKSSRITWIAPSVDRDFHPVWSPDGKQLGFFRLPGSQIDRVFEVEPERAVAIWVADAETGAGRQVWSSLPDRSGGYAQQTTDPALLWARDRLLFFWERDGWMRIYSLEPAGGAPVALSPAACEAEQAALLPGHDQVLFVCNCGDIDRRHVWSAPVAGGAARRLTTGSNLEWGVAATGGRTIGFFSATAQRPALPAVLRSADRDEPQLLATELIGNYPADSLIEPQPVLFRARDGLEIHGQVFAPRGQRAGERRPGLLFLHGGPPRQMLLGWHNRDYYHHAYAMNQFLAAKGYVVLAVNYRSGIGYGRALRRIPKRGAYGAVEYQDVLAGARYLTQRPDVDPKAIGLWGGSYGGYLTALALARDSKIFAAGVDLHGVHDWAQALERGGSSLPPGKAGEMLRATARASSPIAATLRWTSPVLFVHGDDDQNVDFIQTADLVQRLRKHGRAQIEILALPDEVHSFLRHETWLHVFRASADFFDRQLGRTAHAER